MYSSERRACKMHVRSHITRLTSCPFVLSQVKRKVKWPWLLASHIESDKKMNDIHNFILYYAYLLCASYFTVTLHWLYSDFIVTLQWLYSDFAVTLQWLYSDFTVIKSDWQIDDCWENYNFFLSDSIIVLTVRAALRSLHALIVDRLGTFFVRGIADFHYLMTTIRSRCRRIR